MRVEITAKCLFAKDKTQKVKYTPVTECPSCKSSLDPRHISHAVTYKDGAFYFCASEYCPLCGESFIATYSLSNAHFDNKDPSTLRALDSVSCHANTLLSCEPQKVRPASFDKGLETLSPQFVKIYNQALAAESYKLDEIAGMGYRKSLEFLIKDFAIFKNPEDEDVIKSMPLARCINAYIEDPSIKTLVERSVWLGNDETHYVRKHESYNIADMKRFIKAATYFIAMVLIVDEAATIDPA